jgi:hypothetical protein
MSDEINAIRIWLSDKLRNVRNASTIPLKSGVVPKINTPKNKMLT